MIPPVGEADRLKDLVKETILLLALIVMESPLKDGVMAGGGLIMKSRRE